MRRVLLAALCVLVGCSGPAKPQPSPTLTAGPIVAATVRALSTVALVRGPLVQNPANDPTTAALVWYTDVATTASVEWGTDVSYGNTTAALTSPPATGVTGIREEAGLTGLSPGTTYLYRLLADGGELFTGSFVALPSSDQGAHFGVIGDFGRDLPENDALAGALAAASPPLQSLFTVGDNVYTNGVMPYIDSRWLTRPNWKTAAAEITLFPAWGNHDYQTDQGTQQRAIFSLPTAASDERYYRADLGPVTVFVLDGYLAGTVPTAWTDQRDWLTAQLPTARPWKVALYHQSQFRCGDSSTGGGQIRTYWEATFEANGFLLIGGHAHTYSRGWTDRRPKDGKGAWNVTVGKSGQLDDFSTPNNVDLNPPVPCIPDTYSVPPNKMEVASLRNTYLVVDATATTLTARLVAVVDGSVVDTLTLNK